MGQPENIAFTLRICLPGEPQITIRAFDGPVDNTFGWTSGWDSAGRLKLTVEVRHGDEVIFPVGQLYCMVHAATDSLAAKEFVLSLVAMRPGDTDGDYFADYTADQRDWAESYGERLSYERERRYCDDRGNPRKGARS